MPKSNFLAMVRSTLLLLLCSWFSVVTLAAVPAGVIEGPAVEGIAEYTLPNGLTVLLFPDATKP
ncbi:MAG: hypothetical protein ABJC33_08725, partial [Betaproteobacteria bacterium]